MDPDFLHSVYTNCVRLDPLGDSAFLFQRALRVYHNDTAVRRDLDDYLGRLRSGEMRRTV